MNAIPILTFTLISVLSLQGQDKVSSFSVGKSGSANYETISFWVKNGQRTEITYSYGVNRKELNLSYAGKDSINQKPCFKVKFPNKLILYVQVVGESLLLKDSIGRYNKTFHWEYEGPVNGVGTYCTPCAVNGREAIDLINNYFLKKHDFSLKINGYEH